MIFVTVGTHHQPFDALVSAAGALAARGETVWLQSGASSAPAGVARRSAWMTPDAHAEAVAAAEVVVSHAGPATLRLVWALGRRPVVVARDPRRGEHVDEHQLQFSAMLADRAVVVTPEALVRRWPEVRAAAAVPVVPLDPGVSEAFAARFGGVVDQVLAASRRRRGRASLRAWWNL